jgi:hypothetical protein
VSEAAAALVKAVELDMASTTHSRQLAASLKALKSSLDLNMNSIQQVIQNSEKNLVDKIKILNKNVNEVKNEISALRKMQSLEWAIQNVEVGSFLCHLDLNQCSLINSSTIVLPVLCSFRCGVGAYIDTWPGRHLSDASLLSRSLEEFTTKITMHIQTLTGVQPRLVLEADGRIHVYYS